jgi:hypothetical protein
MTENEIEKALKVTIEIVNKFNERLLTVELHLGTLQKMFDHQATVLEENFKKINQLLDVLMKGQKIDDFVH